MIKKKTVLVLGAGASKPYGFPTGDELRTQIIYLKGHAKRTEFALGQDFDKFLQDFEYSNWNSIDTFLAHRPEYGEVGKKCIAAVLLSYESKAVEPVDSKRDHWYSYFWNKFADQKWNDLNFNQISIVSFNYDRSLEYFLAFSMRHAYGVSDDEVKQKLLTLEIQHVYGSLGGRLAGPTPSLDYLIGNTGPAVALAAKSIRVIPDDRASDDITLERCRDLLSNAKQICFLGFGFDQTNLQRLNSSITCAPGVRNSPHYISPKADIYASCLNLTKAEARAAACLCGFGELAPSGGSNLLFDGEGGYPRGFYDMGCESALRHSGALI